MSFLKVIQETDPLPNPPPGGYALATGFAPDRFQAFAIEAIEAGQNVLVTAKTGSGKTFVGEYQIAKSLSRGGRVFYTTPIKSLSNQKFHDLSKLFPNASVGIMTGDIKFRPDAQIIVMTTEILRNLLFKAGTQTESIGLTAMLSLEGLDAVIFDEVHYINDKDRGHVWEETMILMPPHIHLILLSATLSKPEYFANWLGETKQKPIVLISTLWRAVPLEHYVIGMDGKRLMLFDSREKFYPEVYRDWLASRSQQQLKADVFKQKVKDARQAGHEGAVSGKVQLLSFEHQLNRLLNDLSLEGNLPAICFQFSRAGCERLASSIKDDFIDGVAAASVKHIWDFHLARFKGLLETSGQYHTLLALVQRGIAFHHSGLQPFLKEILEILFQKGFIKVLFATETFAVGINMPTKSVIFTALEKYTDGSMRPLTTAEYIQMAGRAGRRGFDDRGLVMYLPQREPVALYEIQPMMTGQAQTFCSRINFHYDFVLKVANKGLSVADTLIEGSYWWAQEQQEARALDSQVAALCQERDRILLTDEERNECKNKADLEDICKKAQNAKRKAAQRDLARWKEEHYGSKWDTAYQKYERWLSYEMQIEKLKMSRNNYVGNGHQVPVVQRRIQVLQELEYAMDDGSLTMKGRMASEVNEGHPFLMTELFLRIQSNPASWSCEEIVILLSLFLGEVNDLNNDKGEAPTDNELYVSDLVKEEIQKIRNDGKHFLQVEKDCRLDIDADPHYWYPSTEWIEPMAMWIGYEQTGSTPNKPTLSQVAHKFERFEGNIQRSVMKLAGLVEEMQALASLAGSIELLEILQKARELILHDIAIAESLYLRL